MILLRLRVYICRVCMCIYVYVYVYTRTHTHKCDRFVGTMLSQREIPLVMHFQHRARR